MTLPTAHLFISSNACILFALRAKFHMMDPLPARTIKTILITNGMFAYVIYAAWKAILKLIKHF